MNPEPLSARKKVDTRIVSHAHAVDVSCGDYLSIPNVSWRVLLDIQTRKCEHACALVMDQRLDDGGRRMDDCVECELWYVTSRAHSYDGTK